MKLRWMLNVREIWDHENLVNNRVRKVTKEVKTLQYKVQGGIWLDVPTVRENDIVDLPSFNPNAKEEDDMAFEEPMEEIVNKKTKKNLLSSSWKEIKQARKDKIEAAKKHLPSYALNIRKARKDLGWTQSQLAVKLSLKQTDVSKIESGDIRFKVSDELLAKISSVLGREIKKD